MSEEAKKGQKMGKEEKMAIARLSNCGTQFAVT